MRIIDLDQITDETIDLSQFLALDDPSQTFKVTLLQLVDFLVTQRLDGLYVNATRPDTMVGKLTISDDTGNPLTIGTPADDPNYILAQVGGANSWFVGAGAAGSDDIQLHSYMHNNSITLKSDHTLLGKDPRAASAQGASAASLTRRDFTESTYAKLNAEAQVIGGVITITDDTTVGSQLVIRSNAEDGQVASITGKHAVNPNWYLGNLDGSTKSVSLYSYEYGHSFTLEDGKARASAMMQAAGFDSTAPQGTAGSSLARKDYVDQQVQGAKDYAAPEVHSHPASSGNSDIVASGFGQVGTYALLQNTTGVTLAVGGTLPGSSLRWANTGGGTGASPAGTWKLLGAIDNGSPTESNTSLWIRIA